MGFASVQVLTSKDPKVVMMCARRLRDTVAARRAMKDANLNLPRNIYGIDYYLKLSRNKL